MRIQMNVTFGFEEMWHMLFLQDSFDGQDQRIEKYHQNVSSGLVHTTPPVDHDEWNARMHHERDWARQMDQRLFMAIQEGMLCQLLARHEAMVDLRDFSDKGLGQAFTVEDLDSNQTVELMNEQSAIDSIADSLRRIYNRGFDPDPTSGDDEEKSDAALLEFLRLTRARHQSALPAFEEARVRNMSPIAPPYINIIPVGTDVDESVISDKKFDDPFADE